MAKQLALGLVIGGAVSRSVGVAFKDVEGRVKKLESTASKTRVLQSVIGETRKLQDEWRKAHAVGSSSADGLRRKLEANLEVLRKQGVQVRNLGQAYEQMGRKARSAELKSTGHMQMKQGAAGLRNTAAVTAGAAAATMIVPTKVSAEYRAVVRDIAIKAGIANTPEEQQVSDKIISTSRDTGMARNEVADVINALVGAGMDLKQALEYAPVAAKFVIGQGAEATDTATMINALGQNALIKDPQDMQKALEAIAFQGQAGSFEASDMAKWFPQLLSSMGRLGITGNDAVTQLGAMLQVQMKTAGSSDEAANNLKNWIDKIGSTDVVKAYKDAGIDYQSSLNSGLKRGLSTVESSFALAQRYIEATNPAQAKAMSKAMEDIGNEADPAKAEAMMTSLEQALRTGDLFADSQVKAALAAYMQGKGLYEKLKTDSASAAGILDKNLRERRETSAQLWKETSQAMDDALRSAGDAMQPVTDKFASGLTSIAKGLASVSDESPKLVTGLLGIGAAVATAAAAYSSFKIAKGMMNVARGTLMGNPNIVQKVAIVSGLAGAGADLDGSGREGRRKRRIGRGRRAVSVPEKPVTPAKPRVRVYSNGAPHAPKTLSDWKPPGATPKPLATSVGSAKPSGIRLGKLGGLGKGNPAAAVFDAALNAKDVYDNAKTRDEKAEGYGDAAGTLAGTLAGAAAGAAIGSVVPIIGTAIGGLIGGVLGGMGGGRLGGVVGKSLFGGPETPAAAISRPAVSLLVGDRTGPAVPMLTSMGASFAPKDPRITSSAALAVPALADVSKSLKKAGNNNALPSGSRPNQKITVSPSFSITVHGDVKDPRELIDKLMPDIERRLTETAQQVARRDMTDQPVF